MSSKLNREAILREMLATLVRGWGRTAIYDALDEIADVNGTHEKTGSQTARTIRSEPKAVDLIEELQIVDERKQLLLQLARAFDARTAFPSTSDLRAFFASHHQNVKEIRSRTHAFRKMIPLLQRMSEKGLLRVISRAQYSGPADLGSISDAIKDAGQNLRGSERDTDIAD
jgi:hypothetical protein